MIATNSGDSAPQSAAVTISETPELHIIFASRSDRRKNRNIIKNPKVSIVIGFDPKEMKTIQMEGMAHVISDPERLEEAKQFHYQKNPNSLRYKDDPLREYFEIVPYWIRYSNLLSIVPEVWEVEI